MKNLGSLILAVSTLTVLVSCDLTHNKYDVDKKKDKAGILNTSSSEDSDDTKKTSKNEETSSDNKNNDTTQGSLSGGEKPGNSETCTLEARLQPGLQAKLKVLNAEFLDQPEYRDNISSYYDSAYYDKSTVLIESFLVNQIDVAPRRYDIGVVSLEDKSILDPRFEGGELKENYGIIYNGYLKAPNENYQGLYQFGVLSDDGIVLNISPAGNLINYNSPQHSIFRCSNDKNIIDVKVGTPLKFNMVYFQGPGTKVANTLLWRKLEQNSDFDNSLCNKTIIELEDFEGTGWEIVPAEALSHEASKTCK